MIDIFVSALFLTATILLIAVYNSYCAFLREQKLNRELFRESKKSEYEALYE